MPTLKIANWNVEWMNRWFTADNAGAPQLRRSEEVGGVSDLPGLCIRVAAVIEAMNADIVALQEGPSRKSEMVLFITQFLGDRYAVEGPAGAGQQKLYTLIKRSSDAVADVFRITQELGLDFEADWEVDVDRDLVLDSYGFTRPPLVLKIMTSSGRELRLINLHAKSKYVHQGERLWRDPLRRDEYVREALQARQRISAEAMRVREYLDLSFAQDEQAALALIGDFNDGPGFDYFEKRYLTHGLANTLAGSPYIPPRMLRHGFVDDMPKDLNWTAIFDDFIEEVEDRKILLDHILLSASLYWNAGTRASTGLIEHDVFNAQVREDLPGEREKLPSDHRPQSVTLEL
ncbi:endonuclease/exonuclease/phosphatase family protein [Algihabitans albus]|uniref:endonuclease/exonuclease/phosphatase family protein n=1 Tax=Algihabitans albus TaxID=2164067 RepID=UPI000E5D5657|nr:hypothetical protein [Algihabitans albus]